MTQNEISSIAKLIIEDENYTFHQKESEPFLGSWSINETRSLNQRPKKLYFSSLPPVNPPKKPLVSLNLTSLLPQTDSPQVKSKQQQSNKAKISQLSSFEKFKNLCIDQPNIHNFQPFHPTKKIKSSRKQSCEVITPCAVKGNSKEKKQKKMVIGLAYPLRFFEKFLVSELLGARVRSKINNRIYINRNEDYNELIQKLTTPQNRSKSMFSENLTERLIGKKTILTPLHGDV